MRYQGILFDLDGTLADTLADIAGAANYGLTQIGRPTLPVARYRLMVGRGLQRLFQQALTPDDEHLIPRAAAAFEEHYAAHGSDQTRPYEGVPALLDALAARGATTAILSNKPDAGTQDTVREVLGRWRFHLVRGHRPPTPLKPDPAAAMAISAELGIAPEHWLYLGDTGVDMQTATGAGMFAVGALWGFRDEAELRDNGAQSIIAHPTDLLALLDG